MRTLRLTDKEWCALTDSLQANEEAHCIRKEELDPDDKVGKDLVDGFESLWKKVWGEPFE